MKRKFFLWSVFSLAIATLSGCTPIGEKSTGLWIIYGVTAILSLITLFGYTVAIRKKSSWLLVLFCSVFVVNSGYFFISVSDSLSKALWANRISYLGSAFLPLSMIMTILKMSKMKYPKWLTPVLLGISAVIFLIAASPGYSDIYYKEVSLAQRNGVSFLEKEYGVLHPVYLFYLIGYFALMSAVTLRAISKKKIESYSQAVILVIAVFVNICVWLLEQLVHIDFEFLSVSYIISELFLLSVSLMIQQQENLIASLQAQITQSKQPPKTTLDKNAPEFLEHCNYMKEQLPYLTASERAIYQCYLEGKSTKEVLQTMNIAENTLKFHNKNIYGKLGVSSRKQLLEYAKAILED